MSGREFWEGLSDGIGYKTGLALSRDELVALLKEDEGFASLAELPADDDHGGRWESVEYEEIFAYVLFKLGRLEKPQRSFPAIDLHHRYKNDPERYDQAMDVAKMFVEFLEQVDFEKQQAPLDPTPFMLAAAEKHGAFGAEAAFELISSTQAALVGSPWGRVREIEWDDEVPLRDLFHSEGVATPEGAFIDQRYIDFLNRNFPRIDEMHWRKFEALTAEFFRREGYQVELGPGRGDDGVDVRVWTDDPQEGQPPTLIAQCKRQKAPVEKVVLKGLYADVLHQEAKVGLIVTTSRLSPGAREVKRARSYPIEEADRGTLEEWLRTLRRPGAGYVP